MRRRPRAGMLVSLVVAATVVSSRPVAAAPAVQPSNRPTPLAGAENGYVAADRLVMAAPGCRVAREAAPSLALLYRTASAANVALGARDCYRPLSGQLAVSSSWTARGNSACSAMPQRLPDGRVKGTSMHGWGKAVDFSEPNKVTFSSPGYRFLKAQAARLGWNHPGWAEPGGSACPEPWHWEWVGDGGTAGGDPVVADVVGVLPAADEKGHATVTGLGAVRPTGGARSLGGTDAIALNWVIVGANGTPDRSGYWLLGADGGIFNFGNARFFGSTGAIRLNRPVVAMAPTPSGNGYWLVAGDGGVFSFGDAKFFGSTGAIRLNQPVVGMASTSTGNGYWLVAADGGIFAFGDARFAGSAGAAGIGQPVVAMAASPGGQGYWLVGSEGRVEAFGGAAQHGSMETPPAAPVVGMAATAKGDGYWLVTADGTVVTKGAAGP